MGNVRDKLINSYFGQGFALRLGVYLLNFGVVWSQYSQRKI